MKLYWSTLTNLGVALRQQNGNQIVFLARPQNSGLLMYTFPQHGHLIVRHHAVAIGHDRQIKATPRECPHPVSLNSSHIALQDKRTMVLCALCRVQQHLVR